jgi:16S rRNA (uracil1498-N3)-methyltransferase
VDPAALASRPVTVGGGVARQVYRVLRLRPGERICLFCGDGREHEAILEAVADGGLRARIVACREPAVELPRLLGVGLAVLKGERLEWAVQKLVEVGAGEIRLLRTARVVPAAGAERLERRLERLAAIAREAVEQCGRVRLPLLSGPHALPETLASPADRCTLIVHPSGDRSLASALAERPDGPCRLLIGPEGGFTPEEVALARSSGALAVTLGPRVLRSETAAIVAAGIAAEVLSRPGPPSPLSAANPVAAENDEGERAGDRIPYPGRRT